MKRREMCWLLGLTAATATALVSSARGAGALSRLARCGW